MPMYPKDAGVRPVLSFLLSVVLALAQSGIVRAAQEAPAPAKLNIVIVEGDGAINNVRQRTAREMIVQVEDENRKPIAGAAVLFMLPNSGPSGVFAGGGRTLQLTTDNLGRAIAKGLRVNSVTGKFQVQVQASYQGVTANTSITQTNAVVTAGATGVSGKVIAILAIVGGAAAGGLIYATKDDKDTPTPGPTPSTTVTAGTPSVGGPQ